MKTSEERIQQLAHDLQYGTAEEAEAAVRALTGLQEQGKIKPHEMPDKLIANRQMRDRINERHENATAKEIAGEDIFGDFPEESKLDSEGVLIEAGVPETQQILRPAVKAFPNVANTPHLRQAAAERVDALVESGEYSYTDPEVYEEAFRWTNEWSTKIVRIEDDAERQVAMDQYVKARGQGFPEEEAGD
jgi:hypothetical protein